MYLSHDCDCSSNGYNWGVGGEYWYIGLGVDMGTGENVHVDFTGVLAGWDRGFQISVSTIHEMKN
jgi:hypothetical protein